MMLLALGANIGGRGAVGLAESFVEFPARSDPPPNNDRLSSAVSAAAPMPKPACLKKYRRVTDFSTSCIIFIRLFSMMLFLGNGLVQIQEYVRHHRPGRQIHVGGIGSGWRGGGG